MKTTTTMTSKTAQPVADAVKIEIEPDSCHVAESTLPNAGKGLFAAKDLKADTYIVEYTGEVLNFKQAKLKKDRSYMKAVGLDKHIDAADPAKSSVARYINDTWDETRRNCKFVQEKGRVYVKTTRDVKKDEEFFIEYGRGHWLYCEETSIAEAFLGLKIVKDGSGGVKARTGFEPKTFLCAYSSLHWKHRFGPGIGAAIRKQSHSFPEANCKLQKNPFLKGTVFVQSIKSIVAGDELILEKSDEFDPRVLKGGLFITGFGKFHGVPENPTTKLVANIRPYMNELGILGSAVWETSMDGVHKGLRDAEYVIRTQYSPGRNLCPSVVSYVHFGVDASATTFCLESRAINTAEFRVPDETGAQPRNAPVHNEDGSLGCLRRTRLDLQDLRYRLVNMGHKVEISQDAGSFICNYTYYSSLRRITTADWGHDDSLFVHVPSLHIFDEQEQLKFARDLLYLLTGEVAPSRNVFNLISLAE